MTGTHPKREIGSNNSAANCQLRPNEQAHHHGGPATAAISQRTSRIVPMECSEANYAGVVDVMKAQCPRKNRMTTHKCERVRVRPRPGRWSSSHLILLATTAAAALLCCERAAAFTRSLDALRLPSRASCLQQSSSRLEMAKGDGKKKRKKKSAAQTNAAAPAASPPAALPMRVTSDSNISVKRQIKWAKMKKEYSQVGQSFRQPKVVRTKYRR